MLTATFFFLHFNSTGPGRRPIQTETIIAELNDPDEKFPPSKNSQGESIWTLVSAYRHWYFGFYVLPLIFGETIVVAREISLDKGIIETSFGVFVGSAYVVTASTGLSFGLAEIARYAMVMAHYFQKWATRKFRESDEKFRNKLLAEGREEGRAENQQAWEDWYASWKDAHARGEDFSKPPPNGKE